MPVNAPKPTYIANSMRPVTSSTAIGIASPTAMRKAGMWSTRAGAIVSSPRTRARGDAVRGTRLLPGEGCDRGHGARGGGTTGVVVERGPGRGGRRRSARAGAGEVGVRVSPPGVGRHEVGNIPPSCDVGDSAHVHLPRRARGL